MDIASMSTGLLSGLGVYICTHLLFRLRPVGVKKCLTSLDHNKHLSHRWTLGQLCVINEASTGQQRPLLVKPAQSQQLREAYGAEVCPALQPAHNKMNQVTLVQFTSVSCYEESTLCWVD